MTDVFLGEMRGTLPRAALGYAEPVRRPPMLVRLSALVVFIIRTLPI